MEHIANNNSFYNIIATVHGMIGLVIFTCGVTQFVLKKGTKTHFIVGRIYFYSWFFIIGTGAYIGSPVIVAIVLMGFYLCLTAIRAAILKNKPFAIIDRTIVFIMAIIVLLLVLAAVVLTIKQAYTYAVLATFFSVLYGFVIIRDVRSYILQTRKPKKDFGNMNWYVNHLIRMQYSFVVAAGAFTSVQNIFGNTILNFTLPAFIGFFIIRRSIKHFTKKLKTQAQE